MCMVGAKSPTISTSKFLLVSARVVVALFLYFAVEKQTRKSFVLQPSNQGFQNVQWINFYTQVRAFCRCVD